MTYFQCGDERTVLAAYSNHHIKGIPFPSRVMGVHDFIYVTSGKWEIVQNGKPYSLETDDVIILTAGERHMGYEPCSDGTKIMFFHVNACGQDHMSEQGGQQDGETFIPLHTVIRCRDFPQIKKIFEKILNAFLLEVPYRRERLSALFHMLLIELYDVQMNQKNEQGRDMAERVLQMIHDNPHLFYTNEDLADMFFVCSKTLVNRFRKRAGMTPHQYQLRYKLNNIKAMLLTHPAMKLHELAVNFGFYDEFHLSRAFKAAFGISPREFKRSEQNRIARQ